MHGVMNYLFFTISHLAYCSLAHSLLTAFRKFEPCGSAWLHGYCWKFESRGQLVMYQVANYLLFTIRQTAYCK